ITLRRNAARAARTRQEAGHDAGGPDATLAHGARPEDPMGQGISGAFMSQSNPTREDFASLLDESFSAEHSAEGSVVKGIITAIEKDMAIIDVGLKVEGRVPLKEFGAKAKDGQLKPGDEVEVYVERIENALGEAMLSREKARREESWVRLEEKFNKGERVEGIIFNQVKGGFTVDLDGAVAFLPRSQVDIRPIRDVTPLMHN